MKKVPALLALLFLLAVLGGCATTMKSGPPSEPVNGKFDSLFADLGRKPEPKPKNGAPGMQDTLKDPFKNGPELEGPVEDGIESEDIDEEETKMFKPSKELTKPGDIVFEPWDGGNDSLSLRVGKLEDLARAEGKIAASVKFPMGGSQPLAGEFENLKDRIGGLTDSHRVALITGNSSGGDSEVNRNLSFQRNQAVGDFLFNLGFDCSRAPSLARGGTNKYGNRPEDNQISTVILLPR